MQKNANPHVDSCLFEAINGLTEKYDIESIYLNAYDNTPTYRELVILVSNKYVKNLGELVPKMVNTIKAFGDYRVLCYVAFQAKDKIREGNLFLFTACQPDKLAYQKDASDFNPIPDNLDSKKCLELANALRSRESRKIDEFRDGYFHFKEQKKYAMAAFMLHQTIELTYRYLELLLTAKERITHSIRCHHRFLQEACAFYPAIFDDGKNEDIHLLQVLEDVYRATRYEDNFQVDLDTLLQLEHKMEAILSTAESIFERVIRAFEEHQASKVEILELDAEPSNSKQKGVFEYDKDNPLESVLNHIQSRVDVNISVFLFGSRARRFEIQGINAKDGIQDITDHYYDLLIVSESDIREQVGNIQAFINQATGVSVLLLSFTQEQIKKQLNKNSPFFHQALRYVEPLFCTENYSLDLTVHENNGVRTDEEQNKAQMKWYDREDNASGFYNGGRAIDNSEEVSIKVLLYNQAIEQACLGLLEYFCGYKPYQHNIKHLYSLCASFWAFPNDIFPRSTEEEKLLFDEFAQTVKNTRYQGWSMVGWDEAYRYDRRCERFLKECSNLVRG
ncbi:HEPN domain-containing protein [Parapedobacter soli]|uniref:HEPN domain-containing protein n=1 Tax=Parapedobacter soli TaxID=416955 RepID=UPI0021CA3A44|nr:HEPN domain-containing protein [Parapedobacter soli]